MLVKVSENTVINLSQATRVHRRTDGSVLIWYAFAFPELDGRETLLGRRRAVKEVWPVR
jgi:hypothetical protein